MGRSRKSNPGPVVTTFEFKPDAGIKYSRITNLTGRSLSRIEGRKHSDRAHGREIDGRHQVPNRQREIIWLRENIESQEFMGTKSS